MNFNVFPVIKATLIMKVQKFTKVIYAFYKATKIAFVNCDNFLFVNFREQGAAELASCIKHSYNIPNSRYSRVYGSPLATETNYGHD